MKNFFICIVYLLPLILYSQSSNELISINASTVQSNEQQKPEGAIIGTVIDIVDRSPIEKATVEILGGMKATTLKDGQFKIQNVAVGFYQIRATAAGYDQQTQNNLYVDGKSPVAAFFMLKKTGTKEQNESENISPVPISTKSPNYPYEAKKNGIEGIFYFGIKVSETGAITAAKCIEKNVYAEYGKYKNEEVMEKYRQAVNQLEKEALEAVWQWKFKPAMKDGKTIASEIVLPIKYKLSKD